MGGGERARQDKKGQGVKHGMEGEGTWETSADQPASSLFLLPYRGLAGRWEQKTTEKLVVTC